MIRNSPTKSLGPSSQHSTPQKNVKYSSHQSLTSYPNPNNTQSSYSTLSRESSPKHHFIQAQQQPLRYPPPPHETLSIFNGAGTIETAVTLTGTAGGATASNSYYPLSHFQCQTTAAMPPGILMPKQINAKYYQNHQPSQQQQIQRQQAATSRQSHVNVMHIPSHPVTTNDRSDHHVPMQFHTATVHGKLFTSYPICLPTHISSSFCNTHIGIFIIA